MDPVQKALWYIESHSHDQLALDDIARQCEVSPFHLTRAFTATMGVSLMRYLRGRRLSEAARLLAGGEVDILHVALTVGYNSHEAFTRAFREHFGLTPERVREQGNVSNLQLKEAIAMNSTPLPDVAPERFEMQSPMLLVGLVERHASESPQGIPGQWQRFLPHLGHIPGQVGQTAYGAVYNFHDDSFDYMCGVEVEGSPALLDGFQALQIPKQRYAVFKHPGHVAGIRSTMSAIWSKWFPQSGYKPVNAPALERYGPEFDPATGLGGFEIWVPIGE
jgi:AraC family transcriptional regulator